ncbi:hypothetical protein F4777DRAFT_538466 [Nemania sp. FL0916]|nr:hypothetical protein F4777DRAFT_538466 [Nemania sp. FL0916]
MEDANLNESVAEHTEGGEINVGRARWWFASAAIPMIAGTIGPVASAFSICALVKPWRQDIVPGSTIGTAVFIHDPPWLLAINGVQLVIAVIANFFLLLNMTKRVRFSIAQPITIIGWYISSFLLVALCATASGPLIPGPEVHQLVWSQAFWYGLFAAVLYFIIASLMVVAAWGAKAGHYPSHFELTMSQRTIMLQTILFLTYLLLGALVFSHIEGWLYLDAVYWADVTLFTVGLGDLSLNTQLGRGLMIPYALIGITTLGLVIGSIRSLMLDRGKERLNLRLLEKKRGRFVRRMMRSNDGDVLEPISEKNSTSYDTANSSGLQSSPKAELNRRHTEFHLMRKIQRQASARRRWMAMGVSTTTWAVLWLVGAKIFQLCEAPYQGWTYFDGVYFAFQAMATIGYGDRTPMSNAGKAFFVFWSLLALPTLTILISNAGDTIVKGIRDATVLVGNITILPGEQGYKSDIKRFVSKLSFGMLYSEEIHELPPGFIGAALAQSSEDADDDSSSSSEDGYNDEENQPRTRGQLHRNSPSGESSGANARYGASFNSNNSRSRASKKDEEKNERPSDDQAVRQDLPRTRAEYRLVLIDEIRRVSQHLQHSPARQYSFREWVWYLRLIGEDESDVTTHRKPERKTKPGSGKEAEGASNTQRQDNRPKWSWVGHRSPLMDTRDEAKWILDKLSQRLREELRTAVVESEGEQGIRRAEDMEDRYRDSGEAPSRPWQ